MPNLSELQFPCHSNKDYKLTHTNVWLELKKMTALMRHVLLYVNKYSTKVGSFLPATGEQFSFFRSPCSYSHCGQSTESNWRLLHLSTSLWDLILAGYEARCLGPVMIKTQTCPKFQWTLFAECLLIYWVTWLFSTPDCFWLNVALACWFLDFVNVPSLFTRILLEGKWLPVPGKECSLQLSQRWNR